MDIKNPGGGSCSYLCPDFLRLYAFGFGGLCDALDPKINVRGDCSMSYDFALRETGGGGRTVPCFICRDYYFNHYTCSLNIFA